MSDPSPSIRLLLADVDGTLVTQDKLLTERAIEAVRGLGDAGILFALTSGRPPRGMQMLIEPLGLSTPIAAFNGGLIVEPDMTVIEQKVIPDELVDPIVARLGSSGLDVWVYQGADWFVVDLKAPHVAREAFTVQFDPTPVANFDGLTNGVAKIVGVSDDHELFAIAALLRGCHPPAGQQGWGGRVPVGEVPNPVRADRDHRRHAERRSDVRAFRAIDRNGSERPGSAARREARNDLQSGGGLRQRR